MGNAGFEGFDAGDDYHMSEGEQKYENWQQAKIWVVIGCFMALCLGVTMYMHISEIKLKLTGHEVVATYVASSKTGIIENEDGSKTYVPLQDHVFKPNKDGNTVTLYYYENHELSAKPMTSIGYWLIMYAIWAPLLGLCIFFGYRNVKGR